MAPWQWAQAQAQMDPNFVREIACSAADFNCTANDLKNIAVTVAAGAPTSCVIGSTINVPVNVASSGNSNTRYDIGAWFRVPGTTNQCNAYVTHTTGGVGFADHEGGADTCGDLTGSGNQTFQNVPVTCQPSAGGNLNFPTTVFWSQQDNGAICNITPGTVSKCNTVATVQNMQFQGTITVKKTATGGTFPFTLSGQPAFNLNGGDQQSFTLNASAAGTNYTIAEGATAGWTSNGVTCTSGSGTQTWQSATPTITVPLSYTHSNITCEFVNTPIPVTGQVILSKTLTANDPGVFTYTLTGTSGVTSGGSGDKLTATGVAAGTAVTFTEIAQSPAVADNYATTWACTGTGVSASGTGTSGSFTMPNPAVGVNCSFNNQRKPSSMTITKTSSVTGQVAAGSTLTYKVVVSNTGEIALNGVPVTDPVPAGVASQTWSCAGTQGGATCNPANGTGAVAGTVDLPAGGVVTYTIEAQLSPSLEGPVINVATVTPPDGTTCTSNCSATVTNEPGPPAPKAVTAIPTTSPEGLAALALMMVGVAGWAARRRRLRR